jgi:23S rRNA pseudouridine1911/1915/1917 synthase
MIIIFDRTEPERVDKYLADLDLPELYSRSFVEDLIDENCVCINGAPLRRKSYKLSFNDVIEINMPPIEPSGVIPQDIPLSVIYEDEYLAVIDKPAGLIVHPGHGHNDGTLVNALAWRYGESLSSGRHPLRPGIVHRLDKDTSGLIVIARDDRTHSLLSDMFADRRVEKRYQAIVCGTPPVTNGQGTINACIDRSPSDPKRMAVCDDGRPAITHYRILHSNPWFSLLDILLETGRTHQIRVHMNYIRHSVFGDRTYSSLKGTILSVPPNLQRRVRFTIEQVLLRQALHACRLRFLHPITKEEMVFESPLPPDFATAWSKLLSLGTNEAE